MRGIGQYFEREQMQIDNYQEASELTEKMKANLPIRAHPTKELIKGLKAQGQSIDSDRTFEITSVSYSGDMGGITCALRPTQKIKKYLLFQSPI
jgi:hypothetical protein